jgi:anthraniloyl-CoA monooxygenase
VDKLRAAFDLVVAADGVNSAVREARAGAFDTTIDYRPNRFVWLGTSRPFPSFFFSFARNAHGLWRAHAYQYARGESTFIVETTDAAWRSAGLEGTDEAGTIAFCEELFRGELEGHALVANRSIWRQFPTVRNARWSDGNLVLLGDAAHTAHFSVGSGTKLAMEDSIALAALLREGTDIPSVLAAYETERRPAVESLQRAAQASLEWFETTERYSDLEPLQFAYSLLTRSLRITHENLRARDPAFVERVEHWFAEQAEEALDTKDTKKKKRGTREEGVRRKEEGGRGTSLPPFLTRFRLRDLILPNRVVVSPMCQYTAEDGVPNDWHMVHLGTRAMGGAGLVMTEMTDVSAEGRISPGCTGMWADAQVAGWRRIVEFSAACAGNEDRDAAQTRGGRAPPGSWGWGTTAARGVADHVGPGAAWRPRTRCRGR